MKTMNFKIFALVAALLTSSFAIAQEVTFEWMTGDTIVIKKTTNQYLTGEQPSKWVYYVQHTIQQVHGKRFPKGILIRGIYSWVGEDDIILKGAVARATVEESLAAYNKMDAGLNELKGLGQEVENMNVEDRAALEAYAKATGADILQQQQIEQAAVTNAAAQQELMEEYLQKAKEEAAAMDDALADELRSEINDVKATQKAQQNQVDQILHTLNPGYSRLDAQHRFSIGVRGGAASLMHDAAEMGDWKTGFDALVDFQYAYYFGGKKVNPGILVGASLGYAQSSLTSSVDTTYTDGEIEYTITADKVEELDGQLQVEIPIMFTMLTEKGFFLNVGPKFVIPVFSHYKQTIDNANVNAYFPTYDVNVSNEVITGLVKSEQLSTKGKWNTSKFNILLTAELGYEWLLKSGNAFGLGVFANYSVWDLYNNTTSGESLINVTAPSSSVALVDVLSVTDAYAKGLGYFDCGLKLTYHFNFRK